MFSLPCTYNNDILTIKCLGIQGAGWPAEEAFFNALTANPDIYAELCVGKLEIDSKNRYSIIVPYSKKLYDRILDIEPIPEVTTKSKMNKDNLLIEVTAEEILKYGY